MDNTTLWQSMTMAFYGVVHDCYSPPLNENPKGGFPGLTIWNEADFVRPYAYYLAPPHGQVPLDWVHYEVPRDGKRYDMCLTPTEWLSTNSALGQCRSRVVLEAKTPFSDTGTYQYTFQAVVDDAKKLQDAVHKRYGDAGVLLVLSREQGSGNAKWYRDLIDTTGIGALVHFQYSPTEDIIQPPPGFSVAERR
jgi:hypothetical protein